MAGNNSAREPLIAYLITVHTEPEIFGRLVRALAAPWTRFFVNVDAHVPIEPFAEQVQSLANVALIDNRVAVNWAGFSQAEATLRMLRAAFGTEEPFARYVLLSGACYPVAGNLAIRDVLCSSEIEYMSAEPMPDPRRTKAITRLTRWHFEGGQRRKGTRAALIRVLNGITRHGPPRSIACGLAGLAPYCGSNWWAISDRAVRLILDTVEARPKLVEFFRYTDCPDECFFQTILSNSALSQNLGRCLTFTDWTAKGRGPRLIDDCHLNWLLDGHPPPLGIIQQPYLFARKFTSANARLLGRIDAFRRSQDAALLRSALAGVAEPALARTATFR